MNKAEIIRLQSENDNLLSVMQYAYDEPSFLRSNVGFVRECLVEWYRVHKKLKTSIA